MVSPEHRNPLYEFFFHTTVFMIILSRNFCIREYQVPGTITKNWKIHQIPKLIKKYISNSWTIESLESFQELQAISISRDSKYRKARISTLTICKQVEVAPILNTLPFQSFRFNFFLPPPVLCLAFHPSAGGTSQFRVPIRQRHSTLFSAIDRLFEADDFIFPDERVQCVATRYVLINDVCPGHVRMSLTKLQWNGAIKNINELKKLDGRVLNNEVPSWFFSATVFLRISIFSQYKPKRRQYEYSIVYTCSSSKPKMF